MAALELSVLAWILTYLIHSTVLLGAAWLVGRHLGERRATRELLWRSAVLGSLLTAGLQVGLGFEPLGGRVELRGPRAAEGSARASTAPPTLAREAARARIGLLDLRQTEVVREVHPLIRLPHEEHDFVPALAGTVERKLVDPAEPSLADPFEQAGRSRTLPTLRVLGSVHLEHALPVSSFPPQAAAGIVQRGARLPAASSERWTARLAGLATPRMALALALLPAILALAPLLLGWLSLRRALAGRSSLSSGPLAQRWAALAARAGLRVPPRLELCPRLDAPLTAGLVRPRVCLPERALELGAGAQTALLAHELAHIERRDPRRAVILALVERLLWFQPLNRLARRELEDLAELACDARALQLGARPLELARCLTEVAGWLVARRRLQPSAPGMATRTSALSARVRRLAGYRPAPQREPRRALALLAATAVLATVCLAVPGAVGGSPQAGEGDPIPIRMRATPAEHPLTPPAPARPAASVGGPTLDRTPARDPAREAAAPAGELEALLELLARELLELEADLAALREAAGFSLLPAVTELEARLGDLLDKRARLVAILSAPQGREAALRAAAPTPSIPDPVLRDPSLQPRSGEETL